MLRKHLQFARPCFRQLVVAHANLTASQDSYPHGPSQMFRRLLSYQLLGDVDAFFLFETDLLPIRPYWLDALYHDALAGGRFWMRGSILAGRDLDRVVARKLSPAGLRQRANSISGDASQRDQMPLNDHLWEPHINGAAFYSLREPDFVRLVDDTFAWLEEDHSRRLRKNSTAREFPYDAAIHVSFTELMRKDFALYRSNVHRMQYTAVVRNLGREESAQLVSPTPESLQRLQVEYPETFLLHVRNGGMAREAHNLLRRNESCGLERTAPRTSQAGGKRSTKH